MEEIKAKGIFSLKNKDIHPFNYDRSKIKAGIVHIGIGNFHRAHEEFYTNRLLAYSDQQNWGICGISLLPSDESLYKALKGQDNLYTLTVCGRNGKNETFEIGSLIDCLWAYEDTNKIINKIADKDIKIITLTITEGGYNIDKVNGEFILTSPMIQNDLEVNNKPKTVFGYVAAGLKKREYLGNGPITILSCDNLQHNGKICSKAFLSFIKAQDTELYKWVEKNVTFPTSMVDRITPAVSSNDKDRLNKQNNVNDAAPVFCEDFIQWVIEDNFAAGRPLWEKVGVEMTNDVSAYENMKLSLLNASHSLLSYPAFLTGYRQVDEAMNDKLFIHLLEDFMNKDITPYVPAPGDIDLEAYKKTLIERFSNKSVSDQLSRLCSDGASKIPVYIMPNLIKMIRDNADLTRLTFFVAAYRHYLKYKKDNKGNSFTINEPWLTEDDEKLIASNDATQFLKLSPFSSTDLISSSKFIQQYLQRVNEIKEQGIENVLKKI